MAYAYHGGASPLQQQAQIYPQAQQYAQPYGPPRSASPRPNSTNPQQIQPGSLTYTTTVESDGQVTYHPFKAIPASYQTAQGIVSGIQWVPAEATSVLPAGATPAGAEFAASFNRPSSGQGSWGRREKTERRYEKEHRYSEEKEYRREREDREYRREHDRDREDEGYRPERRRTGEYRDRDRDRGAYDRERRYSGSDDEDLERRFDDLDLDRERDRDHKGHGHGYGKDKRRERERDRDYRDRERERDPYDREKIKPPRGSPYATAPAVLPGAPYAAAPYPSGTYPANSPSGGIARPISPYQAGIAPRPASPYQPQAPIAPRPVSPYQTGGPIAPRPVSPYQVGGVGVLPQRAASPYYGGGPRPVSPYHGGGAPVAPRPVSPYAAPRAISPYQQPAVYPPGHVMEGRPIQGSNIIPRAVSPGMPYAQGPGGSPNSYQSNIPRQGYARTSPVPEQQMLAPPEGFARPANLSLPYTPFDTMKIQDMDDFFENIPKMPLVLVPHDVYHEDWIRLMTDLSRAWSGKLPVPEYARETGPPRRQMLTADLVDLWNISFFFKRGVEVILYKGRERRSGREIGRVDVHLPGFDDYPGDYDSQDDVSDGSEDDDAGEDKYRYGAYGGSYGRQTESQMRDFEEARQRDRGLREKKRSEKKKRRQEKRHRRRQKEAERKYALYITYVAPLGA